ncbi:hypothetical protein [Streptomyces sp. NPDC046988]
MSDDVPVCPECSQLMRTEGQCSQSGEGDGQRACRSLREYAS